MSANQNEEHKKNVEINAARFDGMAEKYEDVPGARELIGSYVAPAMRNAVHLDKESTTVLDFGCGVGMLSRELAPHVKKIIGVDVSKLSVDVYNRIAAESGEAEKMSAVALDLQSTSGELEGEKFDVVTSSMVYHHLYAPDAYTQTLTHYLKPNGKLLVSALMHRDHVDMSVLPEDVRASAPNMQGFSEERMREMFERAGLVDFKYEKIWRGPAPMPAQKPGDVIPKEKMMIEVFLAEGTKPAV